MAEKLCELKKKGGGGGELKETTLWTNSRPTSSFPVQSVTLPDITPYKLVKVTFRISTSNSTEYYELYTPDQLLNGVITGPDKGQVPTLSYHSGTGRYLKYFKAASTTSIQFSNTALLGSSDNNNYIIPIKITGLK